MQAEKPDLLTYLRTCLNNFAIDIDFPLTESKESNKLYTSEDKFKYMLEKNPQLMYLKKVLIWT